MKNLVPCLFAGGLLLGSFSLSAQTTQTQKTVTPTQTVDRGSEGAITLEEYETLLKEYQKANPGKTFQRMSKEAFETYLTTELAKLRKKRAEEVKKTEGVK